MLKINSAFMNLLKISNYYINKEWSKNMVNFNEKRVKDGIYAILELEDLYNQKKTFFIPKLFGLEGCQIQNKLYTILQGLTNNNIENDNYFTEIMKYVLEYIYIAPSIDEYEKMKKIMFVNENGRIKDNTNLDCDKLTYLFCYFLVYNYSFFSLGDLINTNSTNLFKVKTMIVKEISSLIVEAIK